VEGIIEFSPESLKFTHEGCEVEAHLFPDSSSGRLHIDRITISKSGAIPSEVLRTLPFRAMEAYINQRYARSTEKAPRIRLRVPEGGGKKPDNFYRQVAEAYESLAQTTSAPAKEIADRNGVARSTVHRWVKEARARGLLAPGQKGKAI
jgi:predicted DNA-binding protein (UPF0251 family)